MIYIINTKTFIFAKKNNMSDFENVVRSRRSIRNYEKTDHFDHDIVKKSLELSILSPNSSNMQLWEFYRIISPEAKEKIAYFCLDQVPAKTASELVVFVARPDHVKRSIKFNLDLINDPDNFEKESRKEKRRHYFSKTMPLFYSKDFLFVFSIIKKLIVTFTGFKRPSVREVTVIDKKVTIHKSIALAAQTFMLAVRNFNYDTCPLEGYDSYRIKKYLKLPKQAQINMVVAVGKSATDGVWYPQKRFSYSEVVKEI